LLDSLLQETKMKAFCLVGLSVFALVGQIEGGLLGAGFGHGSCAAFPFRSNDLDHVAGCPRWSECCTEFGYCHGKDSWEKGYFRDCNGVSNGTPLPGSVIRIEAEAAANGDQQMTAEMLGISSEIWQQQIQTAVDRQTSLSVSGSTSFQSGTSSSSSQSGSTFQSGGSSTSSGLSSTGFSGSQSGLATGSQFTSSNSDLVQKIILALQPQILNAVQTAVLQGSSTSSTFNSNRVTGNRGTSNSLQFPQTFNGQPQSSSIDTQRIIALIVQQLEPQVSAAVNNLV